MMRVVTSRHIPFAGFAAINLFGVVVVRRNEWSALPDVIQQAVLRHEDIHSAQGRELLWLGFYLAYVLEWLWRVIFKPHRAYREMSFEREAYEHEWDAEYLKDRKRFAQWR